MKKIFKYTLISLCLAFCCSCDKIDDNGDLGGFWQLTEWKSLPDGQVLATNHDGIYYSVQLDLMGFRGRGASYLSRFSHRNDSLFIGPVYKNMGAHDEEVPISSLAGVGVPATGAFAVQHLTHSKMILRSDEAVLSFRKY